MTLAVVFKRSVGSHRELVFASDSRLSGGQANDCSQKVFEVGRSDCLIAFAGDTHYAYPLLMQLFRSIENYPNSADRRISLDVVKGQILATFRQVYSLIHSLPFGQVAPESPDNFFLFGGFDWKTSEYIAWRIYFEPSVGRFVAGRVAVGSEESRGFRFVGDEPDSIKEAVRRTSILLHERGRDKNSIDIEPLEVLCDIVREGHYPSIGGAPQLGKTYRHLNTQLFQVLWPDRDGEIKAHVAGRPLRPKEGCELPIYDPAVGFYSLRERILAEESPDEEGEEDSPEFTDSSET